MAIAHEIKNPVAAARNVLHLLSHMSLTEEANSLLTIAEEQLNQIARIAEQMLGLCRTPLPTETVNLRQVIDRAILAVTFAAANKRVRFAVEVSPELNVRAVDGELVQIFINLLANAIHYSPEQGTVRIAADCRNGHIAVRVSDNGPGVSAQNAPRLFQPFFTTNKTSGNGLGLWISRELARRVGGDIRLSSSREGATFALHLHPAA